MKIGIFGVGTIGGALKDWFKENTQHELSLYDPEKEFKDDMSNCDCYFICVTCNNNSDGSQDLTHIKKAIKMCNRHSKVFLRSTVLPGTTQSLRDEFNMNIFSCPEFLTQRQALKDMCELPILTSFDDINYMGAIFPFKAILTMSHTECEMAKYTHNCFGAMKVGFFNVIHEQCEKLKINYDEVVRGAMITRFIEPTHTRVPGPDGKYGFGGKCFPVNIESFNYFIDKQSKLLHGVQIDNHRYRNKRVKGAV